MYQDQIRIVIAPYDTLIHAQTAVQDLIDAGIAQESISLVFRDEDGDYNELLNAESEDVEALEGAGFGAFIGLLTGVTASAILVPGIGAIVALGPLVAGLIGGAAGAVTGGITAALVKTGVNEEHAARYEEHLKRGGALVTAQVNPKLAPEVEAILNRHYPDGAEATVGVYEG